MYLLFPARSSGIYRQPVSVVSVAVSLDQAFERQAYVARRYCSIAVIQEVQPLVAPLVQYILVCGLFH